MKTRTAKEKKKAASLLSPYNRRAVVLNDKLDANERDIYYWIITDTTIPEYILNFYCPYNLITVNLFIL